MAVTLSFHDLFSKEFIKYYVTRMDRKELDLVVQEALNKLFAFDATLLQQDNSEWAVAHRLAVYLEQLLPGWNIDCEFNRQGDASEVKALTAGRRVRPDIIVHHRGQLDRKHNLLAIELKKTGSETDHAKIQEYTAQPTGERTFQYRYGLAIAFNDDCRMIWFENGIAIS